MSRITRKLARRRLGGGPGDIVCRGGVRRIPGRSLARGVDVDFRGLVVGPERDPADDRIGGSRGRGRAEGAVLQFVEPRDRHLHDVPGIAADAGYTAHRRAVHHDRVERMGVEDGIKRLAGERRDGRVEVGVDALVGGRIPIARHVLRQESETAARIDHLRRRVELVAGRRRAGGSGGVGSQQARLGNPSLAGLRRGLLDLPDDQRRRGVAQHFFPRQRNIALRPAFLP